MQIQNNRVVTVHYRLQANNAQGQVIEETFGGEPLTFLYGAGQMIPDFEANLEGRSAGDNHSFGIASEDAYGAFDPEAIVDLPIETFIIDGELATDLLIEGNSIPMSDDQGNRLMGTVRKIGAKAVTIDFNHPMAGQDLYFSVVIDSVREASPSEIAHGHVHGAGGFDH